MSVEKSLGNSSKVEKKMQDFLKVFLATNHFVKYKIAIKSLHGMDLALSSLEI